MRARTQFIAAAATAAGLLVACSSSPADSGGVATAPQVSTAPASTTATPVSTSIVTTTSEAPTTTTAPTTLPPSTTLPVEEQVRAAMLAYYEYYWVCLRDPGNCDPAAIDFPGSDAFKALTRTRNELVDAGFYVGAEDPGYMVIEAIEANADHMLVTTCWRSTAVLYGPPPFEGGEPTIQNDTPGWDRETFQLVQDPADNQWKVRRGDTIEQRAEENQCPPER